MNTPTEVLEAKERPILFSGPMVRALLDGRKTQTRRAVKPMRSQEFLTPELLAAAPSAKMVDGWAGLEHPKGGPLTAIRCPYGVPGERLWVRETWGLNHYEYERGPIPKVRPADLEDQYLAYAATEIDSEIRNELRWRPSIHMPRWACRLVLEITDVRVERLHEITEADAISEGADQYASSTKLRRDRPYDASLNGIYREGFSELWEAINGAGSWDANPWVWAVSFRVLSDEERQASRRGGEA